MRPWRRGDFETRFVGGVELRVARTRIASMRAVAVAAKRTEPVLVVASAAEWRGWLASQHARSAGVWLRIGKKGAQKTITYAAALEVALAWGWIDSQKLPFDDSAWIQRF